MEEQNEIFTEIKNLSYNELIDLRNQKIEQYKNKLEEAINTDESAKHGEDGSLKGYLWWESKMINRNLQFIDSKLLHKGKETFNESLKATLEKEIDLLKESIKSMEEAEKKVNELKPMYRNSQIQSANAKKEKIAQILKTDINNLCIKELPEDKAIYYYSKQRGSASLIMDDKNKYLAANSSVNFDNLYQEFKKGKRNGGLVPKIKKINESNNDNKTVEYKSFTEKEFLQIYNVIEEITANDKDSSIKEMLLNEYLRKDTKTGYGSGTGDVRLVIEAFRTINKYEDVKQDFIRCLSEKKYLDDGLEIEGYTAKRIEEKTDFNPLGSYYLLAKLKSDDKDEIKFLIEKGYEEALLHTQTFYPMVKYIQIFDLEKRQI